MRLPSTEPNNSFDRSANSIACIESLKLLVLCARLVNSGVRLLALPLSINVADFPGRRSNVFET
jgi:hypothetical protein